MNEREKRPAGAIVPDGLWLRCGDCREIIYHKEFVANLKICPKCGHHYRLTARERLELLIDGGTFQPGGEELLSLDPLGFEGKKPYPDSLSEATEKSGLSEAVITGRASLTGIGIALAVMDFNFMGGSMGSAVGERLTRTIEEATAGELPLLVVSTSGGARMQEGLLSLMQMAKTSAAVARYKRGSQPFISLLTDPTTGGVAASFATLGDVTIAEPGALVGFTGARVIEQTTRQRLPKGFQSAEFQRQHGMVDMVVPRDELRGTIARMIRLLTGRER